MHLTVTIKLVDSQIDKQQDEQNKVPHVIMNNIGTVLFLSNQICNGKVKQTSSRPCPHTSAACAGGMRAGTRKSFVSLVHVT